MKRLTALLLACMLLLGTACAGAEETAETPKVVSYDFDLQFHLEADHFPFRERKKAQGYEELLDSLEIKGNYSYCEETDCMDLHISLIPVTNPDAALDFRVFGWVANWLNVSSPLLGEDAVCFRPKDVLSFSIRAWDFFSVPLFPFAILFPGILSSAWSELSEKWVAETEDIGDTLTVEAMDRITEYLKNQLDHDPYVTKLVTAAIQPLQERDLVNDEINRLPDLLPAAAGGQDLTVETGEENGEKYIRYLNYRGETIYESCEGVQSFEERLTLPESPSDYKPSYAFRREEKENGTALRLDVSWDRVTEDTTLPETFFRLKAETDSLPSAFPSDAEFSGEVLLEGLLLPAFHFLVKGNTGADGTIYLALTNPDRQEAGPVFTCSGKVVPVPYDGELEYMIGDIITDYNLFALNDQSLTLLLGGVVPAMTERLPDFVYEMPTHGIQSILDTLEQYGLLQITLQ